MTVPTTEELIERWRDEPAPLLPLLHAVHERDGFLTDEALREIASGMRIPLAELFGDVTFYHHLSREPLGQQAPRVCTGPVCRHRGALQLLDSLRSENATPMPCAGRCDEPVPVLKGKQVLVGTSAEGLEPLPSQLPAPNSGGLEECIFSAIR